MKKQNNPTWKYEKPELIEAVRIPLAIGDSGSGCGDDGSNTVPIGCNGDDSML